MPRLLRLHIVGASSGARRDYVSSLLGSDDLAQCNFWMQDADDNQSAIVEISVHPGGGKLGDLPTNAAQIERPTSFLTPAEFKMLAANVAPDSVSPSQIDEICSVKLSRFARDGANRVFIRNLGDVPVAVKTLKGATINLSETEAEVSDILKLELRERLQTKTLNSKKDYPKMLCRSVDTLSFNSALPVPVVAFDQSQKVPSIWGGYSSYTPIVTLATSPENFGELKRWLADNNIESTVLPPTRYEHSMKHRYDDRRDGCGVSFATFKYPCFENAPAVQLNSASIQKMLDVVTSKLLGVEAVPTQEHRSEQAAVPRASAM